MATAPGFRSGLATVNFVGGATAASAGLIGRVTRLGALDVTTVPTGAGAFGDVLINNPPAARTWVLTNNGDAPTGAITINATDTTNFTTGGTCTQAAPGVAVGDTCTVVITANPTAFATATNTVTVVGAGLETNPAPVVAATVRGRTNSVLTAATPAGYGNVPLGDITAGTVTKTVLVSNTPATGQNSGPLGITVDNPDWTVAGCDTERTSGILTSGTCTLSVTVNTTHVGADNATLTITGSPGGTVSVPLTATGIPSITITDAVAAAAATITTHFAADQEVTFTLSLLPAGTNPVATGALHVAITGDALFVKTFDDCSLKSLTAGAAGVSACTVKVKFTGTGAHTATLSVNGTTAGNAAVSTMVSP
jgi:hypothetical protein